MTMDSEAAAASLTQTLERPFPALTGAQRLHLEVFGYVLIENAISADLTQRILRGLYEIEEGYHRDGPGNYQGSHFEGTQKEYFRVDNLPHLDPSFFAYLTHPTILGIAEEAVGGPARLMQSDAHIRRPQPGLDYHFHRGLYAGLGGEQDGLYHYPFVKVLTNLTDLGPDDGGTAVVPGSHKLSQLSEDVITSAARHDPSLIHTVVAPAGSALLFYESLVHSVGVIRSGRDRALIVGGYTPTMFAPCAGYEPYPPFLEGLSEAHRDLLDGTLRWDWQRPSGRARVRRLGHP
jgi:ectoine hydroxylase-related dioxygenase (phytanoyl-CoA dioxygenase family)